MSTAAGSGQQPTERFPPTLRTTAGCVATAAALALISDWLHPASVGPLFGFHLAFVLLVLLAFPQPRSHTYSALVAVLLLGYWPKFMLRLMAPVPYLEPIGAFDGSTASWDRALTFVAAGTAGLLVARLLHLAAAQRRHTDSGASSLACPLLYARYRRTTWIVSAGIVLAAYGWNTYAAVYVTGVNARVVLPFRLNVVLAWCYVMAFPLWIAILIGWELAYRRTDRLGWSLLMVPLAEAILGAGSLLSRATYLLRMAPYVLVGSRPSPPGLRLPGPRVLTVTLIAGGFLLSIAGVMALRTLIYYGDPPATAVEGTAPPAVAVTAPTAIPDCAKAPVQLMWLDTPSRSMLFGLRPLRCVVSEMGSLLLDRWTGLEGVLAVSSAHPDEIRPKDLLLEDPARGTDTIYQRVADARYVARDQFTFLTLAGVIALLATLGSPWYVLPGMVVVGGMLIVAEGALRRATRNELACSVMAVTAAFTTAQVTFPKLYGVFLLELWLTIGALALLYRLLERVSRGAAA